MKTLITYYSYSGTTARVIEIFSKILKDKGEVTIQRLKPKEEIHAFFAQCRAAFFHRRAALEGNVIFDASAYNLILIGLPLWAFAPTPAVNSFLDHVNGLNGKRVIVLLTSGSGVGVKKCFGNIRFVLENKGATRIDEINIPNRKMKDTPFVASSLKTIL